MSAVLHRPADHRRRHAKNPQAQAKAGARVRRRVCAIPTQISRHAQVRYRARPVWTCLAAAAALLWPASLQARDLETAEPRSFGLDAILSNQIAPTLLLFLQQGRKLCRARHSDLATAL